ncbi:MAG: DUF2279 domain-containing protein [Spirochaetota bacterium]
MKIRIFILIILILFPSYINAQEQATENNSIINTSEKVKLPANLYDNFQFEDNKAPYVRYGLYAFGPLFMIGYGLGTWGWNSADFKIKSENPFGAHAINGGVDKLGHLYGNYAMKRLTTFMFKASGSSAGKANLEGALLTEIITTAGEIGDGFGPNYGFDPWDILANQIGILAGVILDYSPFLDRIFTLRWEYFPSKAMRKKFDLMDHHDIFTDYSGSKFMLTTKLGGIPYISLTPLRYINFDAGYYVRGYRPARGFDSRTRNYYIGLSINLSIAFGDILPTGYTSSTMQSFFNYIQMPYINWEAKRWVISDRPQSEWEDEDI